MHIASNALARTQLLPYLSQPSYAALRASDCPLLASLCPL